MQQNISKFQHKNRLNKNHGELKKCIVTQPRLP